MVELLSNESGPVRFGDRLANSGAFTAMFREGMGLVEEAASYLDGEGRREAKVLPRSGALAYATESMRLTTRLMQVASWLLLHRAINEGEMSLAQADRERNKVKISIDRRDADSEALLPAKLRDLIDRSIRVQQRVQHLDASLHPKVEPAPESDNPVARQHNLLNSAFAR